MTRAMLVQILGPGLGGLLAAGRDAGNIDPLVRRVTIGYDNAGRRSFKLDARLNRVAMSYDAASRLTGERYTARRDTYQYDAVGNRTRTADATGVYTMVYDSLNRTTRASNADAKLVCWSSEIDVDGFPSVFCGEIAESPSRRMRSERTRATVAPSRVDF